MKGASDEWMAAVAAVVAPCGVCVHGNNNSSNSSSSSSSSSMINSTLSSLSLPSSMHQHDDLLPCWLKKHHLSPWWKHDVMEDLPSDAETEGGCLSIPSDACTEPEDATEGCVASPCCGKKCRDHMDKGVLEQLRSMMEKLDPDATDEYLCDAIRQMQQNSEHSLKGIKWLFQGRQVCRSSWRMAFGGVGNYRLKRMAEHVAGGFAGAPADLRRTRPSPEPSWQRLHVDNYFMQFFHNPALSETLAEDTLLDMKQLGLELPPLTVAQMVNGAAGSSHAGRAFQRNVADAS